MKKVAIEKLCLVLLAITFTVNFVVPSQNGEFDFVYESNSYKIFHDLKPWQDAVQDCKKRGMGLVSFATQEELVMLHLHLFKSDYLTSKIIHPGEEYVYWTSGNNRQKNEKYMWENSRTNMDYFHWRRYPTEQVGNCVAIGLGAFSRMTNSSCDEQHYYICLRKVKQR